MLLTALLCFTCVSCSCFTCSTCWQTNDCFDVSGPDAQIAVTLSTVKRQPQLYAVIPTVTGRPDTLRSRSSNSKLAHSFATIDMHINTTSEELPAWLQFHLTLLSESSGAVRLELPCKCAVALAAPHTAPAQPPSGCTHTSTQRP
jgi:hypothetical protein